MGVPSFDTAIRRIVPLIPNLVLHRWTRWALNEREAALCLHRVGNMIAGWSEDPTGLTVPSQVLDDLLGRIRRINNSRQWLTLSFDDGYPDAVDYVSTRALDNPTVSWRVFVCPDKVMARSGFRWDAKLDSFAELPKCIDTLAQENRRSELLAAGSTPTTALASQRSVHRLMTLLPGSVGNHSNTHLPVAALDTNVAQAELADSVTSFARDFGPCQSFAFPFGTPGKYWRPEHAQQLKDLGVGEIWSVQSRTFTAAERDRGDVLPRFPVSGHDDARKILALVAARATLERFRGRHRRSDQVAETQSQPQSAREGGYRYNEMLVHLAGPTLDESSADPIILLHGASGHVESFRHLAPLLGRTNPVFGARALGLIEGEAKAVDMTDLIETTVDAIKQLGQPVRLVGYSFGGLIALGVAAALDPVNLLAAPVTLIDTYSPAVEVLPLSVRLRHAAQFGRRRGLAKLAPWSRRLVERQVRGLLGRPQSAQPWRDELGFGDSGVPGLVDLEKHLRGLIAEPASLVAYHGSVRSIRSLELAPNLPEDAGLSALFKRLPDVELLRGDHFSLLTNPFVGKLAVSLLR